MKKFVLFFLICTVFVLTNCSSLNSVYINDKYKEYSNDMIKKVTVVVELPAEHPELATLLSSIAADIIKLRTNYLVYDYKTVTSITRMPECGKETNGVFVFSIKNSGIKDNKVQLDLTGELYNCSSKVLLWKAGASGTELSDNPDLKELTVEYEKKYGNTAQIFASPAFVLIQDMIETVPNPELSDDEIDIKIKLDAKK